MFDKPANETQRRTTMWSVVQRCALSLAAVTVALVSQSVASASCGDYVLVRDAQGRLVRAADLTTGGPMTGDHSSMPTSVPCHGPQCSRLPSAPPAAPLPPIRSLSPPEALLSYLGDHARSANSGGWPADPQPAHPIHHPGRIFRPPRS